MKEYFIFSLQEKSVDKFPNTVLGGQNSKTQAQRSGVVAQMGERLNGIQEVRGSIPLSSTKIIEGLTEIVIPSIFFVLSHNCPSAWRPFCLSWRTIRASAGLMRPRALSFCNRDRP